MMFGIITVPLLDKDVAETFIRELNVVRGVPIYYKDFRSYVEEGATWYRSYAIAELSDYHIQVCKDFDYSVHGESLSRTERRKDYKRLKYSRYGK